MFTLMADLDSRSFPREAVMQLKPQMFILSFDLILSLSAH